MFSNEQPFRTVETAQDYSVFMLDARGIVKTWNAGAARIEGYHGAEIIGRHFSIFYSAEAIAAELPPHQLKLAIEEGRYEHEGWRVRKDGSRLWANVVITPLYSKKGRLLGFAKVLRDLTERRQAEEAQRALSEENKKVAQQLKDSNGLLRLAMDTTSDGILEIGGNWKIGYGNRKAIENLKVFEIGGDLWESFPALKGTPIEEHLRRAMHQGSVEVYEHYFETFDLWYRVHAFPTGSGLSLFFCDVTKEKKLQEQLRLEQLLREKRIVALSHMAGGLAHEISNPLAIIYGRASDLKLAAEEGGSVASAEVLTACESILKTSDRAIRILRGLRGFGREGSRDPMEDSSVYQMVEQCVELQQGRFERAKVELRVKIEEGLPPLLCRAVQIEQILTNLLNNALDAITQAGAEDRWALLRVRIAEESFYFEVTDSGPGVEERFKAHLMEPFFTTKVVDMGMGIGLSLSRAIAHDHGGTLKLCEGTAHTCFELKLPMARGPGEGDVGWRDK